MTDESTNWPSWRYGPDGQEGIFHKEEDVPEGWVDHPAKVGVEPESPKPPKLTAAEKKAAAKEAEEKAAAEAAAAAREAEEAEEPEAPVEPSDF